MASLNEFLSNIKGEGLMRTSRFSVLLTPPASVSFGATNDLRKVLLYCDQVNLPGMSFATAEAKTYGEIREMPYQRLFEPIQLSFYVDNSMNVKKLFDSWLSAVIDPTTRQINYYRDYISDITIDVFDVKDRSRYQVTAYQCYPKSVSGIQMDYAGKDVMKISVTMVFKYWESMATTQYAVPGQNTLSDPTKIPDTYFTNFNSFQSGVQGSFENSRNSLFPQTTNGFGTANMF